MNAWLRHHWLKIVAIIVLFGAFGPFPYVYYQIMDWIVAGAAAMTALQAWKQKKEFAAWIFVAIAVIFNPLAPLYLDQIVWRALDVLVAVLFFVSLFFVKAKSK